MSRKHSDAFPHHPKDVSPAWLTNRLKTSNLLAKGQLESIQIESLGGVYLAQSAIANLSYSKNSIGKKPKSLFIKIARPDHQFGDVTAGEVEFFRQVNPPEHLPIVQCLDSCVDEGSGMNCLILEDLTDTHMQHPWLLPPTESECKTIVKALAQIHAYWWESDRLSAVIAKPLYQARHDNLFGHLKIILPKFFEFVGDRLSSRHKQIMSDVCERLPEMIYERVAKIQSTTLIHGDAHVWNVMLPKNPKTHRLVFIDWEEWTRGVVGFDLANMMALQWPRYRRERFEQLLLKTYHQELTERLGVRYGFDDLMHDYRLSCLRNFMIPVFLLEMEIEPYVWWPYIENIYSAYDDLECEKLL